jgi:hypothetical protein
VDRIISHKKMKNEIWGTSTALPQSAPLRHWSVIGKNSMAAHLRH